MKLCPNCCTVLDDNAEVCKNCGSIFAPEPVTQCPIITELEEFTANADGETCAEQPVAKKHGKFRKLLIAGEIVGLAILVFLVVGFSTNWFGGPLRDLNNAIEKTLQLDSLTIIIDEESETSIIVSRLPPPPAHTELQIILDRNNQDLRLISMRKQDANYVDILIADGKRYEITGIEGRSLKGSCIEIEKDAFRDLFRLLEGTYLDDDETVQKLMEQYAIDTDADTFRRFLEMLRRDCLNNPEWLEEFLGYKKKKDKFFFSIDMGNFMDELADRAYDAQIITKEQKKAFISQVHFNDMDIEIKLEDGYIAQIEIMLDSDIMRTDYTITLSDRNSTEITAAKKTAIIDRVESYIQDQCRTCEMCKVQRELQYMNPVNNLYFCDDCYANGENCKECKVFKSKENLHKVSYYYLCEECYSEYLINSTASCCQCKITDQKDLLYFVSGNYYCYDCYIERGYCSQCSAFYNRNELTNVGINWYCPACYHKYTKDHTCDLCGAVVNANQICFKHYVYDKCGKCGNQNYLYYYDVKNKLHLCLSCL